MSAHDAGYPLSKFYQMTTADLAKKIAPGPGWFAAGLLTAAIFGLHGWLLFHAGGFWRDEVNVINLSGSRSVAEMAHDSFPVLLPLLIRAWTAIGLAGDDFTLRWLGVLIGGGLAGALWLAAWTGRRVPPLISLTLLGLNGPVIFWGDSLRAYGLGSLLIVATLAATCWLLEKPTWQRAGILAVAAVLSVQALYQNAVLVAAISAGGWLVCGMRKDKSAAWKIFAASATAAISLLPYWNCVTQWGQATDVIRPGFSIRAVLDNFHTVLAFPLPQQVWLWAGLGLAVAGLGAVNFFRPRPAPALVSGRLSPVELTAFAGVILILSLAGYLVFLYFAALISSPWYFLPPAALMASCLDLGIVWAVLPRLARVFLFAILFASAAIAVPFAARYLNCRYTNADCVAQRVGQEAALKDYVLVTPWYLGISFNRYYHGAAAWDTVPPLADHSKHRFDLIPKSEAEKSRAMQPVLDRIAATLQSGHRVWVAGWMSVPPPGHVAASAEGRFLAEHSQSFENIDLHLKGPTSDFEEFSLLLVSGWKTNSPP